MTKLSMLAAAIAAVAIPGVAHVVNPVCSSLPDPIVVAGSSAVGPFIKAMGKVK